VLASHGFGAISLLKWSFSMERTLLHSINLYMEILKVEQKEENELYTWLS
jgi:hypothetical protein